MDECKNCTERGNMRGCMDTKCNHHDSWFALELLAENERYRKTLGTAAWALNQTRASIEGALYPNSGMATGTTGQ